MAPRCIERFAAERYRGPTSAVRVTDERTSMVPTSTGVGAVGA